MIPRGTTPFVSFCIGDLINTLEDDTEIYIDFKQGCDIIFEFRENNLSKDYENKRLIGRFSQCGTLIFNKRLNIYIQMRIKYSDGTTIKSNIIIMRADKLVREGMI